MQFSDCSERGHHLFVVGLFACLNCSQRYISWSFSPLVGSPVPNRPKGRDQTKSDPLVLQHATETGCIDDTTQTGGDAAGALMTLLGQSRREAQRLIGPQQPLKRDHHRLLERKDHGGGNTNSASGQRDGRVWN